MTTLFAIRVHQAAHDPHVRRAHRRCRWAVAAPDGPHGRVVQPTAGGCRSRDIFANDISSVFILILAVIGITGEWRHRTITGALLAAPDRLRFLAAKAVAFAGAGLVISLLISAAVTVVGLVFVGVRDLPGPDAGELASTSYGAPGSPPSGEPSALRWVR